jgi:hypothetical protein
MARLNLAQARYPYKRPRGIFNSRLRTHHKSWSDWVMWKKRRVTGSERSNCMWWQDDVILEQVPALSVPKACPGAEKVNEKGLP